MAPALNWENNKSKCNVIYIPIGVDAIKDKKL